MSGRADVFLADLLRALEALEIRTPDTAQAVMRMLSLDDWQALAAVLPAPVDTVSPTAAPPSAVGHTQPVTEAAPAAASAAPPAATGPLPPGPRGPARVRALQPHELPAQTAAPAWLQVPAMPRAGRLASRNAAFQNALAVASGLPVTLDGDLLPPGGGTARGETERAADTLAGRLGLSGPAIRRDLEKGEDGAFEKTALYERVFAYAEQLDKRTLPRAVLPRIELHSPKITRKLTTEWFARRVDERHRRCLERMGTARADG